MRPWVCALAVLVLAAACGGKASGGAGEDDGGSSSEGSPPPGCNRCILDQCGEGNDGVLGGCGDLLDCECPGGIYDPNVSCGAQARLTSCIDAAEVFNQREMQNCLSRELPSPVRAAFRRSTGEAMTAGLACALTAQAGAIPTGIEVPLFAS